MKIINNIKNVDIQQQYIKQKGIYQRKSLGKCVPHR